MSNRELIVTCAERTGRTPAQVIAAACKQFGFSNEQEVIDQHVNDFRSGVGQPDYVVRYCEGALGLTHRAPLWE